MSKRDWLLKASLILMLVWVIAFMFAVAVSSGARSTLLKKQKPESLSASWRLEKTGESITLPTTIEASAMEPVTIVGNIPSSHYHNATVLLRSSQQQVSVILHEKEIYSYGSMGSHPFIKATPSNWNLISIPRGNEGAEIKITLTSVYSNFSGTINEVFIGNYSQCIDYIRTQHILPLTVSVCVTLIGAALCVIHFTYERKHAATHQLLCLGLLVFFIGLWLLSESKMEQFFITNPYIMWVASPIALLLMPIPLVARTKERLHKRKTKRLADLLIALSTLATLTGIALQLLGIYDLIEYLWVAHTILVLSVIFSFGASTKYFRADIGPAWKTVGAMFGVTLLIELCLFYMGLYDQIGTAVSITAFVASVGLSGMELHKLIVKAQQNELLQEKLNNQRLLMITSQIKPHFVYNTLGAIYGQVKSEPETAQKLIYHFSKYLRTNMDAITNDTLVLFSQEIEHIQTYANIEEVRFNGSVHVDIQVDCDDFSLPPLTIQPLVENAIKHGLCQKEEGGTVWLLAKETESFRIITVMDDGVGFDVQNMKEGVGIESVRTRLKAISNATIFLKSTPGKGTIVTVAFPKQETES